MNTERLILGTAQLGLDYGIANQQGQVSLSEAKKIFHAAQTAGVSGLDTAVLYGDSEKRLGLLDIKAWSVTSKLPEIPSGCTDVYRFVLNEIKGSLSRLGVKQLEGFLLHRPLQLFEPYGEALYHALKRVQADGLVRKVGVSVYAPEELDKLCNMFQFDVVQIPLNIFDRRIIVSGLMHELVRKGIEIQVRSVFLQGLLLMEPHERPEKFSRWSLLWKKWDAWLKDMKLSRLEACLAFAFSFPEISNVIVGVESEHQVKQILLAAALGKVQIPDELQCRDVDLLDPQTWVKF